MINNLIILILILMVVLYIIKVSQKKMGEQYRCTLHDIKTKGVDDCKNYSSFVNSNKNLDMIFDLYNSLINNPKRKVINPTSEYIEIAANLSEDFNLEIRKIVDSVLNTINNNNRTQYSLLDIERVIVKKNILNEKEVSVIFLLSEINKFSSRKILLKYGNLKSDNYKPHIDYIKTIQSNSILENMEGFSNKEVQGARIFNTLTINDQLKLLNDICCGKDKCLEKKIPIVRPDRNSKYFNLNKKCQLTNYGPPMEKVFMNPTVFTLP